MKFRLTLTTKTRKKCPVCERNEGEVVGEWETTYPPPAGYRGTWSEETGTWVEVAARGYVNQNKEGK